MINLARGQLVIVGMRLTRLFGQKMGLFKVMAAGPENKALACPVIVVYDRCRAKEILLAAK